VARHAAWTGSAGEERVGPSGLGKGGCGRLGGPSLGSRLWSESVAATTIIAKANAFACGFNVFGPDHVVFATDYPYGRNKGEYFLESRRRFVDKAHIDTEARQKIYEDNAKQLLQLGSR